MQRISRLLILMTAFLVTVGVHASQPKAVGNGAALGAATAWVAVLDSRNFVGAAAGFAEESLALVNFPTREERVQAMAAILALPRTANNFNYVVTRILQPGGIKQVTSCNCGIRDGDYVALTYNVKYTWTDRGLRGMKYYKRGTEVLYMLLEKDGTWKPAAINLQLPGNFTYTR